MRLIVLYSGSRIKAAFRLMFSKTQHWLAITLLVFLGQCPAVMSANVAEMAFRGVISNSFFLGNNVVEKSREFEVIVNGDESSYVVRDLERGTESRATFKSGEYSYTFRGPFTNTDGKVSTPIAARIENRSHPRDDGSWINYLWLGFGSYSYFTSRVEKTVHPIWPTGLREANEANIGLHASFITFSNSNFPAFVAYITDGYEYFEGKESGTLQRKRLRPPFDVGFTNIVLQSIRQTNFDNHVVPMEFQVSRFGIQNTWQTNSSLKLLVLSQVHVTSLETQRANLTNPQIDGRTVVLDARTPQLGTTVHAVHVPATNGEWPDISETARLYERQKQLANQAKARPGQRSSRRGLALVILAMATVTYPSILLWKWCIRSR